MEKHCVPCGGMVNVHGTCPFKTSPVGCPIVRPAVAAKTKPVKKAKK